MTEVIEFDQNKSVCANCFAEAEAAKNHRGTETLRPTSWGTALIVTNQGILTNNLLCGDCLTAIKHALSARRAEFVSSAFEKIEDAKGKSALEERVAQAKEDGATEVTVEQIGTGKTATVDISEFEGQSYQELVDASVNETDAAYSEHEAEIDEIKEVEAQEAQEAVVEEPKPMSNRAKQRAQAALKKVEASVSEQEEKTPGQAAQEMADASNEADSKREAAIEQNASDDK